MGIAGRMLTLSLAMVAAVLCSFREMTHQPLMLLASLCCFAGLSFLLSKYNKQQQLVAAGA